MSRLRARVTPIVAITALLLLVVSAAVADAATGGRLVLGGSNKAGRTTTLANTGSGAALSLRVARRATPPLAVNSTAKVNNLNADSVDGLGASDLVGAGMLFGNGAGSTTLHTGFNVLHADAYYGNLTIPSGAILYTNGFRVFIAGTLTLRSGGVVSDAGAAGKSVSSGGAGGAGAPANSLGFGGDGASLDTVDPTASLPADQVSGGLGGQGGFGSLSDGGVDLRPPPESGGPDPLRTVTAAITGRLLDGQVADGGAGGGACGDPTTGAGGGGGGGGGGVVVLVARHIVVPTGHATISAVGGVGGGTGCGGGGGGVVIVVTSTPKLSTAKLTVSVNGGATVGANGSAGKPGTAHWFVV